MTEILPPTRLRAGDVIHYQGQPCRVLRVNDCSALVAIPQPPRQFTTRWGKTIRLQPGPLLVRISPNAETPILSR